MGNNLLPARFPWNLSFAQACLHLRVSVQFWESKPFAHLARVTAVSLLWDTLHITYLCYDLSPSSFQYASTCVGVLQLACVLICILLGESLWRCGWKCLSVSM